MNGSRIRHLPWIILPLFLLAAPVGCGTVDPVAEGGTCTATSDCKTGLECETQVCKMPCVNDADCATGAKCVQAASGKNYCEAPAKCTADTDCTDPKAPKCDTATGVCGCEADADCSDPTPVCNTTNKKCEAKAGCTTNDDCKADATKPFCNTTSGACEDKCTTDDQCKGNAAGEKCDTTAGTCGAAACTDTATCHAANAGSYCGTDATKGCVQATNDCADNPGTVSNSSWTAGIASDKGCIIWEASVAASTSKECTDSGGTDIPNGLKNVTVNYYCPGATFKTGFTKVVVYWTPAGGTAKELPTVGMTKSGDETSGKGTFGLCTTTKGTWKAYVLDKNEDPSNAICFDIN